MDKMKRAFLATVALGVLANFSTAADRDGDKPLGTANHSKGLVVEVTGMKFDDAKKLVTITWRYSNPTRQSITLVAPTPRFRGTTGRPNERFLEAVYFLETDYRKSIVKDTGDKLWCTDIGREGVVVKPGAQVEFWAKFETPEAASKTISFHVLDTPLIEGIPVAR
jgi:hypothetical protein